MSNIGRAIVKKLAVKFEGNEIMNLIMIMMFSHATEICGRQSQKREMLFDKVSSLVAVAQQTALD